MNQQERKSPPAWMEHLLRTFLPTHDCETIAGDLREEFHDRAASQNAVRAKLWYLRQAVSFAPRGLGVRLADGVALPLLCAFTGLCALWLGAMDLRFHSFAIHATQPNLLRQLAIAASILSQAVVTLAALRLRWAWLRYLSLAGCLGMFFLSGNALLGLMRGYDFEGYVLLIALLLVIQSVLTLCTMPWLQQQSPGTHA